MAKIAFIADVHVGNHKVFGGPMVSGINTRCRQVLDVLAKAHAKALGLGAQKVAILGDLFDSSSPSPQVIAATLDALEGGATVLLGNHEACSDAEGDHALGPLSFSFGMSVADVPRLMYYDMSGEVVLLIPYAHGGIQHVRDVLDSEDVKARLLDMKSKIVAVGMHFGIADDSTPPYLRNSDCIDAAELVDLADERDLVFFSGDWHSPRAWKGAHGRTRVVQCGALVPTGFDNPGTDYGRIWFYDTLKRAVDLVRMGGPRFYRMDYSEWGQQGSRGPLREDGDSVYVQMTADPCDVKAALGLCSEWRAAGRIADFRVVPREETVHRKARSAAAAARSATTLDEAVDQFIEYRALPEGVDKAAVRQRVRAYLGI